MYGRTETSAESVFDIRSEGVRLGAARHGGEDGEDHPRHGASHLRVLPGTRSAAGPSADRLHAPGAPASGSRKAGRWAGEDCTDGELVTLALNGNGAAFSHLMRRHARHLRQVIGRRLCDPDDILDAIQDTQLAVWRALQHYDAGRPFEAWLTAIALNKCRDWARWRGAQLGLMARLQADAVREGSWAEERSIERLLIGRESIRRLSQALETLPPQLRAPLLLTTVQERSQAAAARELGLTRKAVEMRVRRARQHLAVALRGAVG